MKKIIMFLMVVLVVSSCSSGGGKSGKVKIESNETILESFANGTPRIVRVIKETDGKQDFEYEKEYYDDGNLLKEGPIVGNSKDGLWKTYYRDGVLWSEGYYVKGKREGATKSYYPNGKLKFEGAFTNGEKSGQWSFYKEDGSFHKMATFLAPGTKDTVTLELPSQ